MNQEEQAILERKILLKRQLIAILEKEVENMEKLLQGEEDEDDIA